MEQLILPDNLKVHFAAVEDPLTFNLVERMGVKYILYSVFNFIAPSVLNKKTRNKDNQEEYIKSLGKNMRHVIQDSGIFSLFYGTKNINIDKKKLFEWYDKYIEFTLSHGQDYTCIEVDCQDVFGQDLAWDLRYRIARDLPDNRIINVWHNADGLKGLDRLIEYSDYIAFGIKTKMTNERKVIYTQNISSYIKNKKENIDIHILGCTTNDVLRKCDYCTSADSTTFMRNVKFGVYEPYHISEISTEKIANMFGVKKELYTDRQLYIMLSIEMYKRRFEINAGSQDYKKNNL